MPDSRFFAPPKATTAEAIARKFGLDIYGNPETIIQGVAPLPVAGESDLSFVAAKTGLEAALASGAGVLVAPRELADALGGRTLLLSDTPQRDFAAIGRDLYPSEERDRSISKEATIDTSATIGENVHIGPNAVIGAGAEIGAGSEIGACAVLGPGAKLGADCRIGPNASLSHCILGDRVRILAGAVIGQDGFGYVPGPGGLDRIPQLGRVLVGDDVDIGANTTIDRGAGDDTVIGPGTKIDNLVQIGHNCRLGSHCVIVSHCGISGSVTIGDGAQLGGKVGVADHVDIGAGSRIAAGAGVMKDVPAGTTVGGIPAMPVRDWHRQTVALMRLAKGKKS